MRKIKWSCFQNISQINEAKSLRNNVFSQCNYAAVITLQHHGSIPNHEWRKIFLLYKTGDVRGFFLFLFFYPSSKVQTLNPWSKYLFSTFTLNVRTQHSFTVSQLQQENLFVYKPRTVAALFVQDKQVLGWCSKAYWHSYVFLTAALIHTIQSLLNI